MKLYHYSVITKSGLCGWFKDMNGCRAKFFSQLTKDDVIIRTAHVGIKPPKGFHKPNGELAFDAAERIPTMRGLVHALSH